MPDGHFHFNFTTENILIGFKYLRRIYDRKFVDSKIFQFEGGRKLNQKAPPKRLLSSVKTGDSMNVRKCRWIAGYFTNMITTKSSEEFLLFFPLQRTKKLHLCYIWTIFLWTSIVLWIGITCGHRLNRGLNFKSSARCALVDCEFQGFLYWKHALALSIWQFPCYLFSVCKQLALYGLVAFGRSLMFFFFEKKTNQTVG